MGEQTLTPVGQQRQDLRNSCGQTLIIDSIRSSDTVSHTRVWFGLIMDFDERCAGATEKHFVLKVVAFRLSIELLTVQKTLTCYHCQKIQI